jgi:hypothetical protein
MTDQAEQDFAVWIVDVKKGILKGLGGGGESLEEMGGVFPYFLRIDWQRKFEAGVNAAEAANEFATKIWDTWYGDYGEYRDYFNL